MVRVAEASWEEIQEEESKEKLTRDLSDRASSIFGFSFRIISSRLGVGVYRGLFNLFNLRTICYIDTSSWKGDVVELSNPSYYDQARKLSEEYEKLIGREVTLKTTYKVSQ